MVAAVHGELGRAGIDPKRLEAVAADAGYWNEQQMDDVIANQHIPVLVAPDKGSREAPKRWQNEPRANWMRTVLKSDSPGRERYAKRKQTVEPLYGDTKHNKGFIRLHRRGRIKVRTEFRLLMMTPQPHQGLSPPDSHRGSLKRPHVGDNATHDGHATNGPPTSDRHSPSHEPSEKQPPSRGEETFGPR